MIPTRTATKRDLQIPLVQAVWPSFLTNPSNKVQLTNNSIWQTYLPTFICNFLFNKNMIKKQADKFHALIKKCFSKHFWKYLRFHLSVDTWRKSCSYWVCTWFTWRWEKLWKSFSGKLIPIFWVMVLLFWKWPDIKCNDKDIQTFKMEITEGRRRLILNIVTKIRHLKVRSITAWRSW